MGSIDLEFVRASLGPALDGVTWAIETGTCQGASTRLLARTFPRVVSIELSRELHEKTQAKMRKEGFDNVAFVLGNSARCLPDVLAAIPADAVTLLFLDAHWSGDRSVDWRRSRFKGYGADTAHLGWPGSLPSPSEQCPLADELRVIMSNLAGPAYVLVDDMKNLPESGSGLADNGFLGEDWSHLDRGLLAGIIAPRLGRSFMKTRPRDEQWLFTLEPRPAPLSP